MIRSALAGFGTLAVLAVASACTPPAVGGMGSVWPMDEAAGPTMHDSGASLDGAIGAGVVVGGGQYEFPGWAGAAGADGLTTGSGAAPGRVRIADPGDALEPGAVPFAVEAGLRVRLDGTGQLPTGPDLSFNVVQKGRATDRGGFWKMEIGGSGADRGRLRCAVGDGRTTVVAVAPIRVDDGARHLVACRVGASVVVAEVDGVSATSAAGGLGPVSPVEVYSDHVSVGGKPGSSNPGDEFSGWLDQLRIVKG